MSGSRPADGPRVLVVSENTSARFGGEAILPLHYFRLLRRRGVEAWLLTHARTRQELSELLPAEVDRMHFIPDTPAHKLLNALGSPLPEKVNRITFGMALHLSGQHDLKAEARRLVARLGIDVVHEPIPVSPVQPSVLYDLGAPVVMGPMNGGMNFPPAFAGMDDRLSRLSLAAGRKLGAVMNRVFPGKRRASALLVSNERTRRSLPRGARGEVITLVDNGVDLSVWSPPEEGKGAGRPPGAATRFVFAGRLIALKCVDVLLDAFREVVAQAPAELEVLGDGPHRGALERRAGELGVRDSVRFAGWVSQAECAAKVRAADVMVFPSVHDCGGAAVLEAMACGLPVVATNWGGPPDYLDATCGILVDPASREALAAGFAGAMLKLASSPALRERLGRAGRARVEQEFDWERKVDRILEIYHRAAGRRAGAEAVAAG